MHNAVAVLFQFLQQLGQGGNGHGMNVVQEESAPAARASEPRELNKETKKSPDESGL
jgi:hypothetical protein